MSCQLTSMFVNKYTCIIATHCEADPITHLLTKPGRPLEIATKAISPPSYRKNKTTKIK